jgi:microcystin-dependent protein
MSTKIPPSGADKPDAPVRAAKIAAFAAIVAALVTGPLTLAVTHFFTGHTADQAVKDALASEESKIKIQYAAGEATDKMLGLFPGEVRAFAFGGSKDDPAINQLRQRGWLECAGQTIRQDEFPRLYDLMRTARFPWGKKTEQGHTLARLPDLRGVFLRGWMDGRGDDLLGDPGNGRKPSDPDATGATGNSVGSYQPDQFESHQHEFSHGVFTNKGNPNENISAVSDNTGTINNASTITIIGGKPGSETRPRNVYVMYCIYTGKTIAPDFADGSTSNR